MGATALLADRDAGAPTAAASVSVAQPVVLAPQVASGGAVRVRNEGAPRVRKEERGPIVGRLVAANGRPHAGRELRWLPDAGNALARTQLASREPVAARTDAGGRFRLLVPGSVRGRLALGDDAWAFEVPPKARAVSGAGLDLRSPENLGAVALNDEGNFHRWFRW
jgi:hypothetical protein